MEKETEQELIKRMIGFQKGFKSIHHPVSLVRFMKSKFRSGSQLYTEDI
mgnify:CR=1 FL=1